MTYFIFTICVGAILDYFGTGSLIMSGVNELFNTDYSSDVFWVGVLIVAVVFGLVEIVKDKSTN